MLSHCGTSITSCYNPNLGCRVMNRRPATPSSGIANGNWGWSRGQLLIIVGNSVPEMSIDGVPAFSQSFLEWKLSSCFLLKVKRSTFGNLSLFIFESMQWMFDNFSADSQNLHFWYLLYFEHWLKSWQRNCKNTENKLQSNEATMDQ